MTNLCVTRSLLEDFQMPDMAAVDVLGIVAAVENGRGIAGKRVCFVPFAGTAHSLEVGLLYRRSASSERIGQLLRGVLGDSA